MITLTYERPVEVSSVELLFQGGFAAKVFRQNHAPTVTTSLGNGHPCAVRGRNGVSGGEQAVLRRHQRQAGMTTLPVAIPRSSKSTSTGQRSWDWSSLPAMISTTEWSFIRFECLDVTSRSERCVHVQQNSFRYVLWATYYFCYSIGCKRPLLFCLTPQSRFGWLCCSPPTRSISCPDSSSSNDPSSSPSTESWVYTEA